MISGMALLDSTSRWWHECLEIKEEWEVEEKYMLSLDTKGCLLPQVLESSKMLVLDVQEHYVHYLWMLRKYISSKDGVDQEWRRERHFCKHLAVWRSQWAASHHSRATDEITVLGCTRYFALQKQRQKVSNWILTDLVGGVGMEWKTCF